MIQTLKRWWNEYKVLRDVSLAALAALVGALSVYFQSPEAIVAYITVRAAIGEWIKRHGGPQV